jgi:hypothetical protein
MNRQMNQMSGERRPGFTPKQGQYLAFIDAYARVHRRPPAEADMQRYFRVTPPSNAQALFDADRACPAASRFSSLPTTYPSCKRKSNRSKSLCRGTSRFPSTIR